MADLDASCTTPVDTIMVAFGIEHTQLSVNVDTRSLNKPFRLRTGIQFSSILATRGKSHGELIAVKIP